MVILGVAAMYIVLLTKIIDSDALRHIVEKWPLDYFSHTVYSIIPIQLVPFAALGALTGYWVAVRMQEQPIETE